MKELYRFRQFLAEGVIADEITSRVRKLGKEKGIEDKYIEDYIDELDGNFEPDAYENSTDKDLLDDLKSYIDLSEGVVKEEDMSFDSDIEGKTNKNDFAFWYREGAMGKKQALQAQELLKQKGINADYSKGPFYIDFSNSNVEQRVVMQLLRDVGLTRFVVTND